MGISFLTVENRFIDYFKETTENYRGMELIDRTLGGTTPLDVIVDAPADFLEPEEEEWEDPFADDFGPDMAGSAGITGTSYWFNTYKLGDVFSLHQYLDSLPETGKVLSISTAVKILSQLDKQIVSDNFSLAILYKKLPEASGRHCFKLICRPMAIKYVLLYGSSSLIPHSSVRCY